MDINKIPMVRITWLDARDTETGWLSIKEIFDAPLAVCQEVGYMVVNNDDKIVLDAGYRGYVGIEYEGPELSEMDGIGATKKLLEKVRDKLSGDYS